jgi:hypothetical protein
VLATKKDTKTTAKNAGRDTTSKVWTDEERAAMVEHAAEMKAARSRKGKPDGESDILAKIAEMPEADRIMAERFHAIVKKTAPELEPRTWYGMPAYSKDGKLICFFRPPRSSRRATRRLASRRTQTSTRVPCGPPPSR